MKILMVCLGNICRSPLAEAVLRQKAENSGIQIQVDSCGTSGFHVGEAPDSRTLKNALSHGLNMSNLRARRFIVSDFDDFDIIFAMDKNNFTNLAAMARSADDLAKIRLILKETDEPGFPEEVPDPYYGGEAGFEKVFQLLERSCGDFIQKLKP